MSTRATYEIAGETFYIHHDGYPAGAANYFANMIEALVAPSSSEIDAIEGRRGGVRFAFIRGNMRAEPTEGHGVHGDTEHRWRITIGELEQIMVEHQERIRFAGYRWKDWTAPEPVAAFINRHFPGLIVEIDSPDTYWKRKLAATLENAILVAEIYRRKGEGFNHDNPNRATYLQRAEAWERGILEQIPARVSWLEKEKADELEELAKGSSWGREFHEQRLEEIRRELETISRPIGELAA